MNRNEVKELIEKYEIRLDTAKISSSDNALYFWINALEEILIDLKVLSEKPD